jgi:hypothetical protein
MATGKTHSVGLWARNLASGELEEILADIGMEKDRIAKDSTMQDYSVSQDEKQVAFALTDESGRSNLWIAPTSHRTSPVHISSAAQEDSPYFLPEGDLMFRAIEGGSSFLYRMNADGSNRRKVSPDRILDLITGSPDGRWAIVQMPIPGEEHTTATKAMAVDGSSTSTLCLGYCMPHWDTTGKYFYFFFSGLSLKSYAIPVNPSTGLPNTPPAGFTRIEEFANKTNTEISTYVESAIGTSIYAYTRDDTRRNLYRIPLHE